MASADRLIEVFSEAKARPVGAERDQYLAEACLNEPALKDQVLALLTAHAGAGDFLKNPIPSAATPLTEKPGDRIGRYKLLQQIGEGGCGVVYMAEQEEPVRRRVALKVIKLGMDTKNVIARFEAERQALALMDHPNIARVLDAGATETGRPFFVMELVRGIKITDYCDQNNLSTEGRLRLFTHVCHAIQHAHQKGIIHRDIKPSNILVTQNESLAVPKVIDFGIAKATTDQRLTDKTVFTAFEQFIGTPAYMSPEQAMMTSLDIDTRTDIYALGVLLYELLTGQTPFDARELMAVGLDAMRRIIREQEPARPSTRLSTMLEADLTTVASHRHSEPAKLGTLLRGDLDWIVMKALEKDRTRRYETANGLALDIQRHLSNEPVTARPPSRWYEFQKTVRRHKFGFAATTAVILVLALGVVASSWQALRAKRAERKQVELREQAEAEKKNAQSEAAKSRQFAQSLQDVLNKAGLNLLDERFVDQRKLADAEIMLKEVLAIRRRMLGNQNPEVATSLNTLTLVLQGQRKFSEAEQTAREALAILRNQFGNEHFNTLFSLGCLAGNLENQGKLPEAEALTREMVVIKKRELGAEDPRVAEQMLGLAHLIVQQGKLGEAEATIREALAILRKSLGNDHSDVAKAMQKLADVLSRQQKFAEAKTLLLLAAEHADAYTLNEVAMALATSPDPELRDGPKAVTFAEKAVAGTDRKDPMIVDTLAAAYAETGKFTNAVRVQQEAIALLRNTEQREDYALRLKLYESNLPCRAQHLLFDWIFVLLAEEKYAAAEPLARELLAQREILLPDDWRMFNARSVLGGSLLGQKRYAEAESLLLSGYAGMKQREEKMSAGNKWNLKVNMQRLVQLYEATRQSEKVAGWKKALADFDQAAAGK